MQRLSPIFVISRIRRKSNLLDSAFPLLLTPSISSAERKGVYIGIDLISGDRIFWDVSLSPSPHVLVLGPTGSGKTLTLISMLRRLTSVYSTNALIFDVKNEFRHLLDLYMDKDFELLNPLENPLPLCFCSDPPDARSAMVSSLVSTATSIFSLSFASRSLLLRALLDACSRCVNMDYTLLEQFDVLDSSLANALNTITSTFSIYRSPHQSMQSLSVVGLGSSRASKIYIVNLRQLFLRSRAESAFIVLYMLKTILSRLGFEQYSRGPVVVLDELWHVIPYVTEEFVDMLARYCRGLGLTLLMATQNIDDLHPYEDAIANNCGGFIALASPSISYWYRLQKYLNLSKKNLELVSSFAGQGVGVALLAPSSMPLILYVDPLD
uniref:DUF87 domain-containing protein n=1 Tax=Ignisphaera aggregans TaxID=334771 RepID=A0A7C2VAU4_9CREN